MEKPFFSAYPIQAKQIPGETSGKIKNKSKNQNGLPDPLKSGLEGLSGIDLSGVQVHKNSSKPAQLNALAYAQGQDIHLSPGQEKHLPHEGWHVVQQMQGRVKSTIQAKGVSINDDAGLEHEADVMGLKSANMAEGNSLGLVPMRRNDRAYSVRPINRATPDVYQRQVTIPTLGTEATTAPIASETHGLTQPKDEMRRELESELAFFGKIKPLIEWIEMRFNDSTSGSFVFSLNDLFNDSSIAQQLVPFFADPADLKPFVKFLVFHGVLGELSPDSDPNPRYFVQVDLVTGLPQVGQLEQANTDLAIFLTKFKRRIALKWSPPKSVVRTNLLPVELSSSGKAVQQEQKRRKALQAALRAAINREYEYVIVLGPVKGRKRRPILRATSAPREIEWTSSDDWEVRRRVKKYEVDLATQRKPLKFNPPIEAVEMVRVGTHDVTVKEREKINADIKKKEKMLRKSQTYRTFASEVVEFLIALENRNSNFTASNYPGHSWGEYSVDVFIKGSHVAATGFWPRDETIRFFEDVNAVAEAGVNGHGKFAWRAIYNDPVVQADINGKFGAHRIIITGQHGPAGNKLHIHLDLRPVALRRDEITGFEIKDGRVVLR